MSATGQPNRKVMSHGHAIEVPPKPAERNANTKDTGIPSEGAGGQPTKRRCFNQCFSQTMFPYIHTCVLTICV